MLYPEVLTPDNKLNITYQDMGSYYQLSIAPNQRFKIKNVLISTSNRNDTTFIVPKLNKTYHLRYSLNGRPINNYYPQKNSFYLVDVSDSKYNPSSTSVFDDSFDTRDDDMLVAQIFLNLGIYLFVNKITNKKEYYYYSTNKTGITQNLPTAYTWYDTPLPTFTIQKRGVYHLSFSHRLFYYYTTFWCKFRVLLNNTELDQIFHSNIIDGGVEHGDHTGSGNLVFKANMGDTISFQILSRTDNAQVVYSNTDGSTTIVIREI